MAKQNIRQTRQDSPRTAVLAAAIAASGLLGLSVAQASTWTGGGATTNWSDAGNWDTVPSGTAALVFAGTAGLTNSNDLSGLTASSISFSSGAGAFVTSGNDLTLGGNVTNSSGSLQTIGNNLLVTVAMSMTAGSTADLKITGGLSGSGNITAYGNGGSYVGVRLAGNNSSYSGTFTANGSNSHYRFKFDSATAGSANAAWSLNGSFSDAVGLTFGTATLHLGSLSGNAYIRNDGPNNTTSTLSIGALGTDTTFSGQIQSLSNSRNIALTKVGTGKLTLTGANGYTGDTTITSGTLALSGSGSVGSSRIVLAGGTLDVSALTTTYTLASGRTLAGKGTVAGPMALAGGSFLDFSANSSGDNLSVTGALSYTGSGLITVTAPAGLTDSYTLLTFGSGSSVTADEFQLASGSPSSYSLSLDTTGNSLIVTVPEPGMIALLAIGSLSLMARRRHHA